MKKFCLIGMKIDRILRHQLKILVILVLGVCYPSCTGFLDVVPDNVLQYEDIFTSKKRAYNALAACYLGMPFDHWVNQPITLGDEWVAVNPTTDASRADVQGAAIMRGDQSASNTLINIWGVWGTIRDCNLLIQHVDLIPDMTVEEKNDWKAQAKFLKAHKVFRLVEFYGPVMIPVTFDPDELNSDLFQYRNKVEECFDFILNEIDEAIPYLNARSGTNDLGMIDQAIAKSFKARVLLIRASPFYNGNFEYFSNFLDHNGEHFFSQTEDREKWKAAAEAAQVAIDACEQARLALYRFKGRPYDFDAEDFELNPVMQTIYDLCFRVTERWNEEIIWGHTLFATNNMARGACIKKPPTYGGPAPANYGDGWIGASYQAMERYYTEHGLPLDEDRTINLNALHDIVTTPDENSPEYTSLRGLMQPGQPTVNMYLNREPRFYADLGITGGYYRAHRVRINTMMFQNSDGGYNATVDGSNRMNSTGIAVQKNVHPEAYFVDFNTWVVPPYPHIRMADLYLMKAEALNEYYGPSQEVYDAINMVRRRAGIPDVEEAYSNPDWVTDEALDKHLTREGMREIILRERSIEFAFEADNNFRDKIRWKHAVSTYSRSIYGWNYLGTDAPSFFKHMIIQGRNWPVNYCLWPIANSEMDRNAKLIQNPGW